jgi:hypothetical protein
MSTAHGRRWAARTLLGGALAAVGFLAAYLLAHRAAPGPEVIALSPDRGLASPAKAAPRLPLPAAEDAAAPPAPELQAPSPGLAPAPVLHPRDEKEWQGMLVNTAAQALCDSSSRCGLGMACHQGQCGPCAADSECAAGESCVLDHCVPAAQVECHSRRDCSGEETLCVLTGYSPDPRGNAGMKARCQQARGGTPAAAAEPVAGVSAPPAEGAPQELLEAVRAHARATL